MSVLGLRIDVCTAEGLREGVPRLLDLLRSLGVRATFFVAMGPDRSGMAALRVFRRRGFLQKMMRTGAPRMYGLRTMLSGTLLPAPLTGAGSPDLLRRIRDEGHELGIHGWDHVLWHDGLPKMSRPAILRHLARAVEAFESILGARPTCTAAPAWVCSDASLELQDALGFRFASDTRGRCPFRPLVAGRALSTVQIPVTLPTLDEVLGRDGADADGFRRMIVERLSGTQVLTLHAEAEGRAYLDVADLLLRQAGRIVPLGELAIGPAPACPIVHAEIPGRAGNVSIQSEGSRP
jgi:peptidoglycan/xylan/chitin deacetylase (PgdA/CDA1 family)